MMCLSCDDAEIAANSQLHVCAFRILPMAITKLEVWHASMLHGALGISCNVVQAQVPPYGAQHSVHQTHCPHAGNC